MPFFRCAIGVAAALACVVAGSATVAYGAPSGPDWTTYHGDPASTGLASQTTGLSPLASAWTSPTLDGELYGEPLVDQGRVIAATESDTVYVLAASSGAVVWSRHLGPPVPTADVVCGDISPTVGITSTPVVDSARHEIFVVADELDGPSTPSHHLVGLDVYTGRVELDEVIDPQGSNSPSQLQRAALALDDGQVVIGFGSNAGDCNRPYHGYVLAVPEGGGAYRSFEVSTGADELFGSVWMGGASPVVDAQGNIWVATGNGEGTTSTAPYDRSDSVLELSPTLKLEQYFAPARWAADNAVDADLGTTAPALVGNFVFIDGKYRIAYLMDKGHLGGIGGEVASLPICGTGTGVDYASAPFGGDAVDGSTVFVPCRDGVTAVAISSTPRPSMKVLWTTSSGSSGSPIIADGLVWTLSQTGVLYGLDPSTGATEVSEPIGGVSNHFPAVTAAGGLLLVPGAVQVFAFAGPGGLPAAPPAPAVPPFWTISASGQVASALHAPIFGSLVGDDLDAPVTSAESTPDGGGYWMLGADGGVFSFGDARFFGSLGSVKLAAPVVAMSATFDGQGYWLVGADGGIFSFGDAPFYGSLGSVKLSSPIVSIASTPDGHGYWLLASSGQVTGFGGAGTEIPSPALTDPGRAVVPVG